MQSRLKAGWWAAIFLGRWASHMSQEASLSGEIQEQQWQASKEASSSLPSVERRLNLPQKGTSWRNREMTSQKKEKKKKGVWGSEKVHPHSNCERSLHAWS